MKYIGDTMEKRLKPTQLTHLSLGGCNLSVFSISLTLALVLMMTVTAVMPGVLFAEGIQPDEQGNVVLTGTDKDFFAKELTISGNTISLLTFESSNSNDPFENKGKIGVASDGTTSVPVAQISAGDIGLFTNADSGIINFSSGFLTSSLENSNVINTTEGTLTTGTLTNNQGANITLSTGSITSSSLSNAGTISGGTEIKAVSINNSGTIQNADSLTANSTTEGLVNNGFITGIKAINASTLMNNAGAAISTTKMITSTNLTNNGELKDVTKISGTLNNNGSVKLTDDQTKIMTIENLNINEKSKLFVRLFTAGQGNAAVPGIDNDLYKVTNVQVNGGTIVLTDNATGDFALGDQYKVMTSLQEIVSSNEMSLDFSAVKLAPRLAFRMSNDEFNYYVMLFRDSDYGEQGKTSNQRQFGSYIDEIGANAVLGSDLDNVLTTLDALSPGEEISSDAWHALAQMDGAVYGSMATMEVQNMTIVNNTLANYLRPKDTFCCNNFCEDPYNPGCPVTCRGPKMWAAYYGIDGNAKSDGNAFGGDYSVGGVLVGGDSYLTPEFRLGGFFAYGNTEYQVNGLNEQADADSYKAGLYFVREA